MSEHLNAMRDRLVEIGLPDYPLVLAVVAFDDLREFGHFADEYIDLLLDVADAQATVVMNSFTWSVCETGEFSKASTPSECGLASEIFRRTDGVQRSNHPIFSMTARGPLAHTVLAHTGPTCWGDGTPAEVLVDKNAFCVSIGKEFPRSLTVLHSFEEWRQVPYLAFKTFSGEADYGNGPDAYSTEFFVPPDRGIRDIDYAWAPAVDLLLERGLVRGAEFDLPVRGVFAKDLRTVVYELLDADPYAFVRDSLGRS